MLKNICIDNQSWDKALDLEKKLIKHQSKSKNEESMLNYFIAMDYKKKDNQKNYINFLERSVLSEHVYHESYLELAKVYQKKGDIDLAIKNLILFADKEPNASIKTFKDIENMLFEKNRFNEMEELYQGILSSMFHKYVFNRLIDIYLEKNDEDAARELIEKFAKQHEESYIIKLNRIKLDTDDIELRKSLSEVCYSVTLNEDNN
jgi:lipopolysaccharide biosynthesis regulator YciM